MYRTIGVLSLLLIERLITLYIHLNLWEWILLQSILFLFIPLIILFHFQIKKEDVGLSIENIGIGLKYSLFFLTAALPFMIYGASLSSFKRYYPIWSPARDGIFEFIILELAVLLMMLSTEFYFRGLLLLSLEDSLTNIKNGRWIALCIHSMIYMLAHIGKPGLEVPYSFFAGLAFGWIALASRSIVPSFVLHWSSSVIFDVLVIRI